MNPLWGHAVDVDLPEQRQDVVGVACRHGSQLLSHYTQGCLTEVRLFRDFFAAAATGVAADAQHSSRIRLNRPRPCADQGIVACCGLARIRTRAARWKLGCRSRSPGD